MLRKIVIVQCLVMCCTQIQPAMAQGTEFKRFNTSLSTGIGLPMIPFSQFRAPISVTGGIAFHFRASDFFIFELNAGGLYSFNLGSFDNRKRALRFDLIWSSVNCLYQLRGTYRNYSFISFGIGEYYLYQRFDQAIDKLTTPGMQLGIIHWRFRERGGGAIELKWHLLFEPGNNPQVATITYGWIF